jgi:uncharacterized protein
MKFRFLAILLMSMLFAPIGCEPKPQSTLPTTTMQIGGQTFTLEIAISPHDQAVGLMHRDSLAQDHGMIFISPQDQPQTYWNHDVHFPLDLIFLDSNSTVVSLKHMEAYNDASVSSDAPAKYVIELNSGVPARLNVKVGDKLTLPQDVLHPASQLPSQ